MARFGDNPLYLDPPGDLRIPCEYLTTDDDYCLTPDILTQFAQENMDLASGTNNGLISGPEADKLAVLYTKAQLDSLFSQLGQFPFPIFIANPVNGSIEIYRHIITNPVTWGSTWFALSSGTAYVTVTIDGVPVTGWENIHLTSASTGAVATGANVMPQGSILGLTFAGCGSPVNLRLTLGGQLTLAP